MRSDAEMSSDRGPGGANLQMMVQHIQPSSQQSELNIQPMPTGTHSQLNPFTAVFGKACASGNCIANALGYDKSGETIEASALLEASDLLEASALLEASDQLIVRWQDGRRRLSKARECLCRLKVIALPLLFLHKLLLPTRCRNNTPATRVYLLEYTYPSIPT